MAPGEQAHQHAFDDLVVTDDHLRNFGFDDFELLLEEFDLLVEFCDHGWARGRMASKYSLMRFRYSRGIRSSFSNPVGLESGLKERSGSPGPTVLDGSFLLLSQRPRSR